MSESIQFRRAAPRDAFEIVDLYQRVYSGTYTDPMMAQTQVLRKALENHQQYFWAVAAVEDQIIGSVVYHYDSSIRFAKVYAGVVEPRFRGQDLTERLMQFGYDELRKLPSPIEVVYATTRTVSPAPQRLTAKLGYKKLGIFPNVHKTEGYETHCLTALISSEAIGKRFTDFELHPKIRSLYEIVQRECGLAPLTYQEEGAASTLVDSWSDNLPRLEMEPVHAPKLAMRRFQDEKKSRSMTDSECFFPFHSPNLLLTTPDQEVEVFCHYSQVDKHCVLIGLRDAQSAGYGRVLSETSEVLHSMGARYLEFLIRADESDKIEMALRAGFIPSAYFPVMHLLGPHRYDYVVFSRSYEILNFRRIRLEGVNREYLQQYIQLWKETSLELEPAGMA